MDDKGVGGLGDTITVYFDSFTLWQVTLIIFLHLRVTSVGENHIYVVTACHLTGLALTHSKLQQYSCSSDFVTQNSKNTGFMFQ
jgi:hypothetical protein